MLRWCRKETPCGFPKPVHHIRAKTSDHYGLPKPVPCDCAKTAGFVKTTIMVG